MVIESLQKSELHFEVYSGAYGLIVGALGLWGYLKARSKHSLIAGVTFASFIEVGSYLEARNG